MPYISLFVIFADDFQRGIITQNSNPIFISDASPDLYEKLENATIENEISIFVNGIFDIVVDDPKVIRREAQKTDEQSDDFLYLYSFLSSWPNETVNFEW